jgi:hypothetical protein
MLSTGGKSWLSLSETSHEIGRGLAKWGRRSYIVVERAVVLFWCVAQQYVLVDDEALAIIADQLAIRVGFDELQVESLKPET